MSSSSSQKFYVFLSFRGQETRRTFVSHLRCSLDRRGITTLEDENELRGGKWEFERTIQASKVAVVLISETYASSPWCLESLVKILGLHNSGSIDLISIFYDIDPSDVRKQSGKLHKPFSLHERENPANVQTWRQTLSQLADIPSCMYSNNWKGDAEMIGKITDDIWGMMICSKSTDLCGLVGMDRHMKAMYKLLDLECKENKVCRIYILGMKGIGKTELAKFLYDEVLHHFDIHFWLDVPERSKEQYYDSDYDRQYERQLLGGLRNKLRRLYEDRDPGPRVLRRLYEDRDPGPRVLRRLYEDRDPGDPGPRVLRRLYEDRDPGPRVLLVLDNVTERAQLNSLEWDSESFGPGSKVIINVVNERDVDRSSSYLRYEVVGLEFSEGLQLFCLHAFEQTHPSLGFEELSCRAVKLTGGSPSTIKKLGTSLFGKDLNTWEVLLSGYERSSDKGIINSRHIYLSRHSSVTASVSTEPSTISNSNSSLIGMGRHMRAVYQLLELEESDNRVRVVSIWGTGGIGKTTLARYVYEAISQLFDTHVFLQNDQDRSSSFCLEERFLSETIERDAYTIRNSKDCSGFVKSGLGNQKVLLVVDGVDNTKALEDVRKIASWFGPGSRVIVTTRDESLANGVKHVYEVKCLRFDEALQLFYQFALKEKSPSFRLRQLSVRAIKLVGSLPLALKVTGSMLYGKSETDWETILQTFEEKQDKGQVEV